MAVTVTETFEALTLGLGGEIFAIDANSVHEILDIVPQTEVPGAPPLVSHLINVRGKVVPLADLRIRFGMECTPPTIDTRIVVVEILLDEEPTVVGLLADKVHEVTSIAGASIEDTPDIGMRWNPELIKGIGKRGDDFIVIPDIVRIFTTH
jgi:purine-binding chemotaxis protein CheW